MKRHEGKKCVTKLKKPVCKDYILSNPNYMKFQKRQDCRERTVVAGVRSGGKVGGINRQRTDLQASENTLYLESCHTFVQTYRMHNVKSEP